MSLQSEIRNPKSEIDMFVRSLRLHNFRNYAAQEVQFSPGLVVLTGDNGQGKTNLLEALCVLATTKSPLVERDRELLRWDTSRARLEAHIELSAGRGQGRDLAYEWRIEGAGVAREMQVGGVPQSALLQWLGQMQVVAFFPHDLTIITGDPGERRRFLNLELGKTRPVHFADAARYRRSLQQRNALLKHLSERRSSRAMAPSGDLGSLSEWNRQIVTYGARICQQREQFLDELAPLLNETQRVLSGLDKVLCVTYSPGVKSGAGESWSRRLSLALEADHESDLRRGSTQSGPHRDDLIFTLDDIDLRRFGSQGQQRLAVLALKIALARWVETATGEAPILLLDDALSELDATRRAQLLHEAARFPQSILTATDATFLHDALATVLHVEAGRVTGGA